MPAFYFNRIFEQNLPFFLFYYLKYWIFLPCQFSSPLKECVSAFWQSYRLSEPTTGCWPLAVHLLCCQTWQGKSLEERGTSQLPLRRSHLTPLMRTQSAYRLISPHISEFAVPHFLLIMAIGSCKACKII